MEEKSILIFSDNMFFTSSISGQLAKAGLPHELASPSEIGKYTQALSLPVLAVVNLNANQFNSMHLVAELKKSEQIKVVGFCGHGLTLLMRKGKEAGCDWVIPNSVVTRRLVHFLKQQEKLADLFSH